LIAYLQRLGTDIKALPAATEPPVLQPLPTETKASPTNGTAKLEKEINTARN
jgi:hypothetical protein